LRVSSPRRQSRRAKCMSGEREEPGMGQPHQPGWYDDPLTSDRPAERYWDGTDWTPRRRPKAAGWSSSSTTAPPIPQSSVHPSPPVAADPPPSPPPNPQPPQGPPSPPRPPAAMPTGPASADGPSANWLSNQPVPTGQGLAKGFAGWWRGLTSRGRAVAVGLIACLVALLLLVSGALDSPNYRQCMRDGKHALEVEAGAGDKETADAIERFCAETFGHYIFSPRQR